MKNKFRNKLSNYGRDFFYHVEKLYDVKLDMGDKFHLRKYFEGLPFETGGTNMLIMDYLISRGFKSKKLSKFANKCQKSIENSTKYLLEKNSR